MSQGQTDDATLAQIRAADPGSSTWVSANAGSGKTRVLTDRVARLLLDGVAPQRILCLTYTKAAAAHMQNKLFERLGAWAMLADGELRETLHLLGENGKRLHSDDLARARTLFARALETPGGLKIQTIHSFCAAILRQFPLEAGVSPQFREMDERSGKRLRADIMEMLADGPGTQAFDAMADYFTGADLDKFLLEIASNRDAFVLPQGRAQVWQNFALPEDYDEETYLNAVWPDWLADLLPDVCEIFHTGSAKDQRLAEALTGFDLSRPSMETAAKLEGLFVYGQKVREDRIDRAKTDAIPTRTGGIGDAHPDLVEALHQLMHMFEVAKPRRQALVTARKTLALHQFAQAFLTEYTLMKSRQGWLDFDDMILKARDLLTSSSMTQWVLYRLDGGIDHILVDEAQDTNPQQWQVIARLAEEFFTGQGAGDVARSLFVVGDEKQSIFSFQGADPAKFAEMQAHFATKLADANSLLKQSELLFSFRSSPAILRLVDVMLEQMGDGGMTRSVTHRAFHGELPGRIDLWPFLEPPEKPEPREWFRPVDMPAQDDPALVLARRVADAIRDLLAQGETLPTTKGNRPVRPGDFLILVQQRSDLFHEIIRALKERGLPVAGADRLKIGGELAVRDLLALLSFLATPEDDLSLASVLRSPIFGWSEDDLYALAQGRNGFLWPALRAVQDQHRETFDMLDDLLKCVDFLRPYELLERILTRHKGRENLIARLGHEAEDGVDALLSQAMAYEQAEPPSLTGFLVWMEGDKSDIKRQIDTESGEIRVMTVHGAKGLESPIVILPDTGYRRPGRAGQIVLSEAGQALWNLADEDSHASLREATAARALFQKQERLRLFYVALTRAENWLILCGAGTLDKDGESWYSRASAAFEELPMQSISFFGQDIQRYETSGWPTPSGKADAAQSEADSRQDLPGWARSPAPPPAAVRKVISPSALGGAKVLEDADAGLDEAAALARGRAIHLLLEHLPEVAEEHRAEVSDQVLAGAGFSQQDPVLEGVFAEVTNLLNAADLAFLFAPDTLAEVPLTAPIFDGVLDGIIDRLVIGETDVLAVDFKSNAAVPTRPEDTPEGLLRQMGAYGHALAQIYPEQRIRTAILWTRTADLMEFSPRIVTDALSRATTS